MPDSIEPMDREIAHAMREIRASLADVYRDVGADPSHPQDVSRRFGLDKNLTWKISRIVSARDPLTAVHHLPGPSGLEILLKKLGANGASVRGLERVRVAQRLLDEAIEKHAGDRSTMELVLDAAGASDPGGSRFEVARKLAFRGNSGIFGVQARVRTTTVVLAPNAQDPSTLDHGMVGGLVDFRRLRPGVRWPLFRIQSFNDDGRPNEAPRLATSIEPGVREGGDQGGPQLLREFCTGSIPRMIQSRDARGVVYDMDDGPVGNVGAFTLFFGSLIPGALGRYRTADDTAGEVFTVVSTPIETLIFDLLVHEDLEQARPELRVYGRPSGDLDGQVMNNPRDLIPVSDTLVSLGTPLSVDTPLVPQYPAVVERLTTRMGVDPNRLIGNRLIMKYPPMPSTIVMRFALPPEPGMG